MILTHYGCSADEDALRGYWKLDMDPNARRITQTVVEVNGDSWAVLSYLGGPMLMPGQNTQNSEYALMGEVRCGAMNIDKGSGVVTFTRRVKTSGEIIDADSETYTIKIESDTSFYLSGQSKGLIGRYIRSGVKADLATPECFNLARNFRLHARCQHFAVGNEDHLGVFAMLGL